MHTKRRKERERNDAEAGTLRNEGGGGLSGKRPAFFKGSFEGVVLHAQDPADGAGRVRFREIEGGPVTIPILVVGEEVDLIEVLVGIELEDLLVVVVLSVDERDKKRTGIRAEDFS